MIRLSVLQVNHMICESVFMEVRIDLDQIYSVEMVNHKIDKSAIENDTHSTGTSEISLNSIRLRELNWL